jgi:dTMP kinase
MAATTTRALLVDIEGIDGSGKGTQAARLCQRLTAEGVSCGLLSFPRYSATLFGRAVGEFLNGAYGTLDQVHPFLVSLLFAGDRFESRDTLRQLLEAHEVVVLDRYVPSNIAHQAAKVRGAERTDLMSRILEIEHRLYGLPRADLVLWLDLPVETAQQLVARKARRDYTERTADLQEADGAYLGEVAEVYQQLARTEPGWRAIECAPGGELLTVDAVHERVWDEVSGRLAARSAGRART